MFTWKKTPLADQLAAVTRKNRDNIVTRINMITELAKKECMRRLTEYAATSTDPCYEILFSGQEFLKVVLGLAQLTVGETEKVRDNVITYLTTEKFSVGICGNLLTITWVVPDVPIVAPIIQTAPEVKVKMEDATVASSGTITTPVETTK